MKLLSGVVVAAVMFAILGWVGVDTLETTKVNGPWYDRIVQGKDLVADVLPPPEYIIESYLIAHQMVLETDRARVDSLATRISVLRKEYDARAEYWTAHLPDGPARTALLQDSHAPAVTFFDVVERELIPAAQSGDRKTGERVLQTRLVPLYEHHRSAVDKVVELAGRQLRADEQQVTEVIGSRQRWFMLIGGLFAVALGFAIFNINRVSTSIIGRLGSVVQFADAMSRGDMTRSMHAGTEDEVGRLIAALNTMSRHVRQTVAEIQDGVQVLSSSSTELAAISTQVAGGVRHITDRSNTVAAASEESSAVAASMASQMRDARENLNAIAGAAEELSATIASIASDSERARTVTDEASAQAAVVTTTVRDLGHAAQDIGKVTETIADISAQTNLLALNATIEAARAGAAGKGFSVVASEIKELARQTASATDDIKTKIGSVQTSTAAAIGDIEKIGAIIEQVTSFVTTVASTIEEQALAMKDVASRVAHSSQVVRDAGAGADDAAQATRQIAADINNVSQRIGEISEGGRQIETSSSDLSNLSNRLQGLVSRFSV